MDNLPFLVAAIVMIAAVGVALWAGWTLQRAENELLEDAALETADFDIGTWPVSTRVSAS